ncbi:MAG: hypothetical protein IKN79_08105 [Eubacterium sp.]|nr:hypothetical protein [Eubacterium sp.]
MEFLIAMIDDPANPNSEKNIDFVRAIFPELTSGGKGTVAMLGVEDLLFGSHKKVVLNQGTGISETVQFTFNRNLDGVFDEKDATVDYSRYHFAVLESKSSFFCGNLFPTEAKEHGILILGETSGGSSCNVASHATADGLADPDDLTDKGGTSTCPALLSSRMTPSS